MSGGGDGIEKVKQIIGEDLMSSTYNLIKLIIFILNILSNYGQVK